MKSTRNDQTEHISAQPLIQATQLVKGVMTDDPDAHVLATGDPRSLLEGLTSLSLLLAAHLGGATGRTAGQVLDAIQATSIRAIADGLATG